MNRILSGALCVAQSLACLPLSAALAQAGAPYPRRDDARRSVSKRPSQRGVLTLSDAVAAALRGSPTIAPAEWEIRVRAARLRQATALPNPALSLEVENIGGSGDYRGVEQTETTVSLAQLIEIGGKRDKRRRAAALAGELARWDAALARLEVRTETTRAFARAVAAQRAAALAGERFALARNGVEDADKRVKAGAAPALDATRAELASLAADLERRQATAARGAAYKALAAAWGEAEPRFSSLQDDWWDAVAPPLALARLEPHLVEHPALARWTDETAARRAEVALLRAERLPDPSVALGARYFSVNDDAALVFAVGLPLPLFDRKQGDLLAAEREVAKAGALAAAAAREARTALAARHAEMSAAYETIAALRDRMLPTAARAYEEARRGYTAGALRSLEVLDAQRTLFELRSAEIDAVLAYHLARVSLEQLTAAGEDRTEKGERR